jgi:Tfp pilus tip-associated adhesin PilY1
MKTTYKHTPWKIIAATTAVISGLLYAIAVFVPDSTPTVTLGKYALKNRDLFDGPTKAYRSWFENGAWQGDLIEYEISTTGSRSLNHTLVGSNDDTALIALARDATKNWMARATFLKNEYDIADYWKEEGRRLFTYNTSAQVSFLWNNLTAAQKISLDPETINDPNGDGFFDDTVDPATAINQSDYFGPVFNFIRGDRSNERSQTDGFLRTRYSLLGDVTNTPVYIGPPRELFTSFDGYREFRDTKSNRPGAIATPANDGILHFFAEADGSETKGYIPSMVIEKLFRLAQPAYEHTYYLDGEMAVSSAQVVPNHDACTVDAVTQDPVDISGCEWRTVLAGGGGPGFEGLFALDVTTPGYTGAEVLFEKTGGDFGHIYGAPRIAALGTTAEPDWYVFTGSGYKTACSGVNNSVCDTDTGHPTALLMVSLADLDNTVYSIDTNTNGGLSSPALVSTDKTDLTVDIAFAGDINGDLWMFRLDKTDPDNSTFRKVFNGVPNLPITNTPAVSRHPNPSIGGYMVYFGTGSIFSQDDVLNDAMDDSGDSLYKQAIYGIHIKQAWIDGTNTTFKAIDDGDLQLQELNPADSPISAYFLNNDTTKIVRTTPTNNPVSYYCNTGDSVCEASLHSGWRLEFPICGERLVGAPFVRARRVQFVTTNPTGLDCGGNTVAGDSWMMSLDYLTGTSADKVVFNLNGDSELTEKDRVDGVAPVGLTRCLSMDSSCRCHQLPTPAPCSLVTSMWSRTALTVA